MKNLKRISLGYILVAVFAVFLVFAELFDIQAGQRMAGEFYTFSMKMVLLMPCTFILIGLLDVWIPKEQIKKHIGEESGLRGAVYIILLAVFQGGPLYVAFPAAHLLWKKGCSMRNIFLYLGAFSTVKIPMILFEASFLGWRFTLVRAAAALPVFVIIAEIMTVYTRRAGLQLEPLEDHDSDPKKV